MTRYRIEDFDLDRAGWHAAERGLGRQIVIALAYDIAQRGPNFATPEALEAWELLRAIATGSELMRLAETESAYFIESIREMARSDAHSLGADNPPTFDDAVDVWEELDDEDQHVLRAIRRLPHDVAQRVYREEWQRIRAGIR